jgi:hypothetical protein
LKAITDFLNQGWLGLVFTAFMTYVGYRWGSRQPALKAMLTAEHALTWGDDSTLPKGFDLRYKGQDIPRVARGVLRLWNTGSAVLGGDLISQHDRLRLELSDGAFLIAAMARETNQANQCRITLDSANPTVAFIDFDFLGPRDGMLIGFLHTSTVATPELRGTLKGLKIKLDHKPAKTEAARKLHRRMKILNKVLPYGLIAAGVLMGVLSFVSPTYFQQFNDWPTDREVRRWLFWAASATYVIAGAQMLWTRRRRFPQVLNLTQAPDKVAKQQRRNP